MATWYSLWSFGTFFPFCTKKNLATGPSNFPDGDDGTILERILDACDFLANLFRQNV
jgi:hypothetical protein